MVELEASQTLPFPLEEAAWDFATGPGEDGSQALLLVAARRQLVEEQRRLVESTGLRLGALTVDVLGTAAVARAALPEETGFPGAGEGAVVARLDAAGVTLCYLSGGRVAVSRTAALGAVNGWDAEALALEVRRTVAAGAAGTGVVGLPEVRRVWLTGAGADAEFAEAVGLALRASGLTASQVALLPRDAVEGAEELPRSVDLALGLALLGLRPAEGAVDLGRGVRTVSMEAASRPGRRLPALVGAGAAALALALLLLGGPGPEERQLAAAAARAQAEVRQLATRRGELEGRVRNLTGAVVPRHSYLDVLNEVSALAGAEIWLTQFTYDRGRPITIRGAARSSSAVARVVERLRGSPHLQQVTLGAMTVPESSESNVVQFTIQGTLRGDTVLQAPRQRRSPSSGAPGREPV
jgi:Tfp pilus assembly protein PilN